MSEREAKSSFPAKPSIDEVCSFLSRYKLLIVHCSGTPKGIGTSTRSYPHDLQHVWQGHAQGGISCSLLGPGDRFHGFNSHSTGTVGLVVAPTEPASIVAVSPHDAGSYLKDGVRVVGHEVDIGISDLERSLSDRGDSYNEWVVRDFNVVGLFVASPATTWQSLAVQMPEGMPTQISGQDVPITVHEIAEDFDGLPIYTLSEHGVLEWTASGWRPVAHSDVYSGVRELSHQPEVSQ